MYLRKLEILGFKSFANKTTIRFSDGLTAIVGPNGCGKTNVLDALRWVLGEQKPTLLRGGRMEEVIFTGTRDTKPLGMAEVSLTIMNDRGILPTEYSEVQITRRLFRSGDSEYMINKVPCRLRDITEMFADTGLGAHSYSVIQQDMIDAVISDKAEERRSLFEEAAGITKYKQRRKEALRKLEATEQDSLRLQDIYAEVKTRVNSLYRQHKKAERYQRIVDEIKGWDLYLGSQRLRKLQDKKRALQADIESLSTTKTEKESQVNTLTATLEADRATLLDVERSLTHAASQVQEVSDQAHKREQEISVLTEKRQNAEQVIARNEADIQALQQRLDGLKGQVAESDRQITEQQRLVQECMENQRQAESAQTEADKELHRARSSHEEENRRLFELEGKLSSDKTLETSLRQQQNEISTRIAEIERQLTAGQPRQQEAMRKLTENRDRLDALTGERGRQEARREELNQMLEQLTGQNEELALQMAEVNASIEACEARRKLLEEMILHYEGYESGVVAAMDRREEWTGIAGTVAELFVPVAGMEVAAEAALGEIARFVICRERAAAEEVIAYLRSEKKGRIGILVPSTGALPPAVKRPELNLSNVVGWLDSFVATEDSLRSLRDAILARTVVFQAGTDPAPILEHLPFGFTAVSTDGVLYGSNTVTGGSNDSLPLFRRKEKIRELENELVSLSAERESLSAQKNQTVASIGEAKAESGDITAALEEFTEQIDHVRRVLQELEYEHRSMTSDVQRLLRERQELAKKLEVLRDRQYQLELDSTRLTTRKQDLVENISRNDDRLENLEMAAAKAVEAASRAQIASIEARNALDRTQSQRKHLQELQHDIEQNLTAKQHELADAHNEVTRSENRMTQLEAELKAVFEQRDTLAELQSKAQEQQTNLLARVADTEDRIRNVRSERDEVAEQLHRLEIQRTTLDSEITSVVRRLAEEYEVDISRIEPIRPESKLTDEETPDYLARLREKLKKFGAVNLLALEEYREVSEREEFLRKQLDDLDTARKDLKATISRINHTARELFSDTIDKARSHFQELFIKLFAGGEADIRLTDPNDPLESDIEIIARPRGKKLLSITMMSGGERALTSIALLFSLYLVKPSPFCILDEIDAPLDDANCHRFLDIVHNFSSQTQFITITHNKITMEAADNLYGVTMEQPGISKLVGVRFAGQAGSETDAMDVSANVVMSPVRDSIETDALPEPIQDRINPDVTIRGSDNS